MNRIRSIVTVVTVSLVATLLGLAVASPASASPVVGGQFCADVEHYLSKGDAHGRLHQCQNIHDKHRDIWRWLPLCPPVEVTKPPTVPPTAPPTLAPVQDIPSSLTTERRIPCVQPVSRPTPTATKTAAPVAQQDTLPVTGSKTGILVGLGILILSGGAGMMYLARRRRTKFEV